MSTRQNPSADKAADLFVHYFSLIANRAGVPWDSDNVSEIRTAVDHLMDAARTAAREEVEAHLENDPHLYADGSSS